MSYENPHQPFVPTERRPLSSHVPLAIFGVALLIFLVGQLMAVAQQGRATRWQIDNNERAIASLVEGQKQLAALVEQRETLVKQSSEIQNQYQSLLNDLLKLSDQDADAKQVIEKWKIQRSEPAKSEAAAKPLTP